MQVIRVERRFEMVMTPKIATCCYCGTRAALRLDNQRHELTCSNCGAPLRNLKHMALDEREHSQPRRKAKKTKKYKSHENYQSHDEPRRKPKKRRRSLMSKVFEEAFDVIEDIFD